MGKRRSESNFIIQGSILAIASVICRLIGIIYRIPLTNIIGNEGNGYYSCAFEVYSIMLLLSSYSLPVAVSKLVSARLAKGEKRNAYRIYKGALIFAGIAGITVSVITYFGADFLAGTLMSQPMSSLALKILAPTLVLSAIMGVLRGYFQGLGTMIPTVFSQIIEQIVNAGVSVAAAFYLFSYGQKLDALLFTESYAPAYGAAGGTLGTGAGVLFGLLFLLFLALMYKQVINRQIRRDRTRYNESYSDIFLILILTIVPVILSTAIYNINSIIDQGVFNKIMMIQGNASNDIAELYGVFTGKYKLLTNVPLAIANALAASTVPTLSRALAEGKEHVAVRKISTSIRFTMIIVIPCAVGLTVLASPILQLLFHDSSELPARLLQIGSISTVLYALSTLTNGILQGLNHMNIPVRNAVISLILHLVALVIMLGVFKWGIYAVVFGNIIFALIMCILNGVAIRKVVDYEQEIKSTFVIPGIAAIFMGVVVYLIYFALFKVVSNSISTLLAIIIGGIVYFILLVALKGVAREDLERIPKGYILISIVEKFHLM
ncbi:putative polysaccharide biosynthesis protein [Candidatus Galacturonibacter soehngenii]|uniref:Polysaccharide biosynthesis protein n=1 Tax=Candidatus Galacturonatibacter soehngenii TaxID=2307010 RepID=A0A7V7UCL0_9FIRM|nr:polysaccharide biosynthesis protein [Candidatus Galacturonibacter soehngenii]KAB1439582.1 polysaccharide biosynthesis protein [Candidatus Galacturonibacter soehngenii]